MTYRIQMTRQAAADVDAIYEYIARRSISGADSWYEAFYEARKDLTCEPEKFALSTANEFFPGELREHFFRTRYGRWNYCILFAVASEIVYIVRVHGPGEDFAR